MQKKQQQPVEILFFCNFNIFSIVAILVFWSKMQFFPEPLNERHVPKSSINILSFICFARNGLLISSHISYLISYLLSYLTSLILPHISYLISHLLSHLTSLISSHISFLISHLLSHLTSLSVFTVTLPTLIFASDPMNFYTEFR